jgi:hypothetical protein
MEFCFVVFSHAGTDEKEEILHESLKSIKGFGYPIILASHLPVSRKNQDLVDYFIKDKDNLIVDEGDIINPNPGTEISQDLYYVHDWFGGKTFSTNTFKQTYQSGVFNLYINSVNLVKRLGFKNIILWEFDFLLGKIAAENFSKILSDYSENEQRFFSFGSYIQGLNCMQAIPSILDVEMLSSFFPVKPIKDPKSFAGTSNLMIMEQWVRDRVNKSGENGRSIDYTYMNDYLPDSSKGQVHSQLGSYMFFNLRSGIYFSESDEKMIYYTSNSSTIKLKSILEIRKPSDSSILYVKEHIANPNNWAYDFLPDEVILQSLTDEGINVTERIEEIESGKIKDFAYSINKNNRDYVSRLRKYS